MFVWNLLSSIVGTNKRMINVRFKYGCEWVRLLHDACPLWREPFPNHKLGTANGSIPGGSIPPCGIALTHSSA